MIGATERERLRRRLHAERDRLARRLERETADLAALRQRVSERDPCAILGPAAASEDAEREVRARRAEETDRQRREIDRALTRLEDEADSFGVCVRCGEGISPARLDILPATTLCERCASARG
jgi:DnaK suppressor protein